MHYLEDWLGLLKILAGQPSVAALPHFVGLFSLGSDGNRADRDEPGEFSRCQEIVRDYVEAHFDNRQSSPSMIFDGFVDDRRLRGEI
jgi:hypothetical protein